jgi:CheY-like chemotaxis protein
MTPGVQEKIFEPYFTTKKTGEGTGMGLAVVHDIVKSYQGAIEVHSEPGKGTTFRVFLPRIEGEVKPETMMPDVVPEGNERILFVDDEAALANLGKYMLERLGYQVESRTSSIEALEAFRAQPDRFDLVITDMTMPNMTGMELAKEIIGIRPTLPVVICTGYSDLISEDKAKAMDIREFIMKPVIKREIAHAVRRVLDQK